jgi:hypothetical protein
MTPTMNRWRALPAGIGRSVLAIAIISAVAGRNVRACATERGGPDGKTV